MKPASKIKPTIIDVKMFNWRIHGVKFSELNKNSTISEYRRQLQNGYETCQVRIDEIMLFTGADYRVFCNNFLTDFDWLAGKGGYSSDYSPVDANGQTLSHEKLFGGAYPDELEAWKKEFYTIGILCINADNNEMIVVDPEGHSYARYVGFVS